ncbi:hypothetical protein TNCT_672531 [Trichonephila clavata]|uniref:Uncharacterized protein n=1 Tax=Trichonephila clavata TaxID=2740835 RepID=A0A8X6I891_TRICU|nr:hypothetical protein TNCT_672531 [Trichonephila clavata]
MVYFEEFHVHTGTQYVKNIISSAKNLSHREERAFIILAQIHAEKNYYNPSVITTDCRMMWHDYMELETI